MARRAGERHGGRHDRSFVIAVILVALGAVGCTRILGDFSLGGGESGAGGSAGGSGGEGGASIQDASNPVADADSSDVRDTGLDDAQCTTNAKGCIGQEQRVCTQGSWHTTATCPFLCMGGECVGICTPGERRCLNNTFNTCQANGTWDVGQPPCSFLCIDGKNADAGPPGCRGVCAPGSAQCKGGTTLQTCNMGGMYEDRTCAFVCKGPAQMMPATCGGSCKPSETQCDGNQPRTCNAVGEWENAGDPCPFVCQGGRCAGSCTNGTLQCSGRSTQVCMNGIWMPMMTCPYVCQSGVCVGECVPGTTRCFNQDVLETCGSDGRLMPVACPFVCRDGGCTGECRPGAIRCNPANSYGTQRCDVDGTWVNLETCTYLCYQGTCNTFCAPSDKRCHPVSGLPEICDPTGNWVGNGSCSGGCLDGGVCAGGG